MFVQSKKSFSTLITIGIFLGMLLYNWQDLQFDAVFEKIPGRDELFLTLEEEQTTRLARLHQTCKKYRLLMKTTFYKKAPLSYLAAPAYKWTACKAGKMGSTFWSRFFYILNKSGSDVNKVLYLSRKDLHTRKQYRSNSKKDPRSYSTRRILTVRNPYTRLFSAYIDRIFTTSTTPLELVKNKQKCKSQITFTEFLKNVIVSYNKGETEYHWIPLFHHCKPCEIDPDFIVKIESLKTDFPLILKQTNLESYKADILNKTMAENTNFSINTLVDDVLDSIAPQNRHHALDCQSMKQITIRLWEAFKIQGYVAEKVPFPFEAYSNEKDYENSNIFRNILVETLKLYPMTTSEVTNQRRRALNKFYEKVDKNIIEDIKKIYNVDFELFGYSKNPPPW